jgi:hypothetical protein
MGQAYFKKLALLNLKIKRGNEYLILQIFILNLTNALIIQIFHSL